MSFLSTEQLPFEGMSHEFEGEKYGAPISAYLVNAKQGEGPALHTHPYAEVLFTIEGHAIATVGSEQREIAARDTVVVPPNTPHRFVNSGKTPLRQIDVHANGRFIQTDVE
ncbi:MAG: cupin domain-containing protein [Verrucomicrobia bacterium]|nr:cupin domain-containing protein [Verrucomicrobiota bacterium]